MDPPGRVRRPPLEGPPPAPGRISQPGPGGREDGPDSHLRRTHTRRANRMTPHNWRASSARVAPSRTEPGRAPTVICLTRRVVLSTGSLPLHRGIFQRKWPGINRRSRSTPKAPVARSGRLALDSDIASAQAHASHASKHVRARPGKPVRGNRPGRSAGITGTFITTSSGRPGGK